MKIWAPRASPQQGEGWYPEATPTGPHGLATPGIPSLPQEGIQKQGALVLGWTKVGIRLGVDKMVSMRFLFPLLRRPRKP